jgi:hypothetical protein
LKLLEDSKKGVCVHGLEEIPVTTAENIFNVMEKSKSKRITAATALNSQSSRSHCIFTITIHMKESTEGGEDLIKVGKLNLVDLAGSENMARAGTGKNGCFIYLFTYLFIFLHFFPFSFISRISQKGSHCDQPEFADPWQGHHFSL